MHANLKILILAAFCWVNLGLHAGQIKTIQRIAEVIEHLCPHKQVIVVFDVDNTLLHPITDLGSDQWVVALINEQMEQGLDYKEALKQVLPLYVHVAQRIAIITTEEELSDHLDQINKNCHHTLCLTARSLELAERVLQDFVDHKLIFRPPVHHEALVALPHPTHYRKGVIFCDGSHKGETLLAFFDYVDYVPDLVIFVDDKESNVRAVVHALEERGIACKGLRYAGCDERVQNFDKELTRLELEDFLAGHPFET